LYRSPGDVATAYAPPCANRFVGPTMNLSNVKRGLISGASGWRWPEDDEEESTS
jgi:hypothetical protein